MTMNKTTYDMTRKIPSFAEYSDNVAWLTMAAWVVVNGVALAALWWVVVNNPEWLMIT